MDGAPALAAEGWRTVGEALASRAAAHPGRIACIHLERGEAPGQQWSYAELLARAREAAAGLQARAAPGERVLLAFPNEPAFVVAALGCLLAGLVVVPVAVPRNAGGVERLRGLARAAGARLAVVSSSIGAMGDRLRAEGGPDWLDPTALAGRAQDWRDPGLSGEALAVLQFTSGSTGAPKGVMVRHASLLHNARMLGAECGGGPGLRLVAWLPFFHDWGLVGCLLFPLLAGGTAIYFDPADLLQRPRRWLEAITRFRATVTCAPTFAYDLAARAAADPGPPLDLSSLELAMLGAEPVRWDVLEGFAAACAPHGLRPEALHPSYGLAEGTLIVTGGRRLAPAVRMRVARAGLEAGVATLAPEGAEGARDVVGCGRALLDGEVRVADPGTGEPLADGRVGEVWARGPSVAAGYWERPEDTERTFGARFLPGEAPWLRTGDLGFLASGELFVCGRLKDVVIKAGANHFAEDLEHTAGGAHEGLRPGCGAAFGVDAGGQERLVIVHEVNFGRKPDLGAVVGAIQRAISREHGVLADAVALLRPGALEKTSSGKIRRAHGRRLFEDGALDPLTLWQGW